MDIAVNFDGQLLTGDINQIAAGLETEPGLKTAVIISLFSDARAGDDDELPFGETDRRGWWGDMLAGANGPKLGSKLWLLQREKHTTEVLRRAESYAKDALQWLIDDGIAASVLAIAEWVQEPPGPRGFLGLRVEITRPSGADITFRFDHLWQGVA